MWFPQYKWGDRFIPVERHIFFIKAFDYSGQQVSISLFLKKNSDAYSNVHPLNIMFIIIQYIGTEVTL